MGDTEAGALDLSKFIRDIPDFPKPGILFKDITPLLIDPAAFGETIRRMCAPFSGKGINRVAAAEARGFLFAAPMALELGAGLVPIRKPGKLPHRTIALEYDLEYGSDTLEIHYDALGPSDKVLIVDDVLATGGTMRACAELVSKTGASVVGCAFALELEFLKGRSRLGDYPVFSLLKY